MIYLENVLKYYRISGHRKVVLNHVSFNFQPGRNYGILGVNGAGKSTLIRILAGVELPNNGTIRRSVRTSWPLGFSGGLHKSMTGRENARFVARAYGEDIRRVVEFVEDFAEIGPYFDAPIGTYSSGMKARIAFGLSMAIDFDCYLIDEVMAVGDGRFRQRCREEFEARRARSDIILCSHSVGSIREYCQHAIVLSRGRITAFSNVNDAIEMYNRLNTYG
jgi:capsular polysaccharide transport system ATP-binding protein